MTMTSAQKGKRDAVVPVGGWLPSFTGMRVLAITAIFLSHTSVFLPIPYMKGLLGLGAAAVMFFFVLSGFVLTWTFNERDTKGWFYGRRFAQIYPLMALAAIVPAIFSLTSNDPSMKVNKSIVVELTIYSLLLLLAWVPGMVSAPNPVIWSISALAFFYAIFPFIVRPVLRRSFKQLAWIAAGLIAFAWAVRIVLWIAYPPQRVIDDNYVNHAAWLNLGTYSPISHLQEFLIGVVAAAAIRKGWRAPSLRTSGTLLAAGLFVMWLLRGATFRVNLTFDALDQVTMPLFALFIASLATRDLNGGKTWLAAGPMRRLGNWAFAFFLFHIIPIIPLGLAAYPHKTIVDFFRSPPPSHWANVLWALLALLLATGVSALLYRYVEAPINGRLRRRLKARYAGKAPTTAPAESHTAR